MTFPAALVAPVDLLWHPAASLTLPGFDTCFPLGSWLRGVGGHLSQIWLGRWGAVTYPLGRQIQGNGTRRDLHVLSSWLTNMNHQRRFSASGTKIKQELIYPFGWEAFPWKYQVFILKSFLEQCIYPRCSSRPTETCEKNKIGNFSSRNLASSSGNKTFVIDHILRCELPPRELRASGASGSLYNLMNFSSFPLFHE